MMFAKEYSLEFERSPGPGTLILTHAESSGRDLDDLLSNVLVSFETTRGNEGPDGWTLDDCPDWIITAITQDITEALAESREHEREEAAEQAAEVRALNKDRT